MSGGGRARRDSLKRVSEHRRFWKQFPDGKLPVYGENGWSVIEHGWFTLYPSALAPEEAAKYVKLADWWSELGAFFSPKETPAYAQSMFEMYARVKDLTLKFGVPEGLDVVEERA